MFILFRDEKLKAIVIEEQDKLQKHYMISNYGRVVSYNEGKEDFYEIKRNFSSGFNVFRYKINENEKIENKTKLVYRLVATNFLEKPSDDHNFIIHLDYNSSNDHYSNLKWVTLEERKLHHSKNPNIIEANKKALIKKRKEGGIKLSINDVIRIKKRLIDPKRKYTLKQLAKKFKVSDMQIHRIKTGENWQHIDKNFNI